MFQNRLFPAYLAGILLLSYGVAATFAEEPKQSPSAREGGVKPLKVFVLAGQSNMQGHASISTFDSLADDPKMAPILEEMRGPDGKPIVCDKVWISSIGCLGDAYSDLQETKGKLTAGFGAPTEKIGPEFTFGITMEKLLGKPILIIKTSWGGRSLHTDSPQMYFRQAQAAPASLPEFKGNVVVVPTAPFWDDDLDALQQALGEA